MKKNIVLVLLLIITFSGIGQRRFKNIDKKFEELESKSKEMKTLEGLITYTSSYCGGAPPPQQILDELRKPKPLANQSFYIRKDKNNFRSPFLYEVKTDQNGKFQVKLPIGKYTIVDEKKKSSDVFNDMIVKYSKEIPNQTGVIDQECLEKYMMTADMEVEINSKSTKVVKITFNYHKSCDWNKTPCLEYKGAMPQ